MWMPLVLSILPKTLLKWATPQSKSSIKFKTKTNKESNKCFIETLINNNSGVIIKPKNFNFFFFPNTAFAFVSNTILNKFLLPLIKAQYFLGLTVINNFLLLMNDFRFKTLYRALITKIKCFKTTTTFRSKKVISIVTSKTLTNSTTPSLLTSATTTAASAPTTSNKKVSNLNSLEKSNNNISSIKNFDSSSSNINNTNNNNNHRTYNNSSKSNKVFLYYIPRDPRLRINNFFNKKIFSYKRSSIKHDYSKLLQKISESELKIIENLCNNGELIGGSSSGSRSESGSSLEKLNKHSPQQILTLKSGIFSKNQKKEKSEESVVDINCDKLRVPSFAQRVKLNKILLDIYFSRYFKEIHFWFGKLKLTTAAGVLL